VLAKKEVPRIFKTEIISNLNEITDIKERKKLFIKVLLPLILKINDEILEERSRLEEIETKIKLKKKLYLADEDFISEMSKKYNEPEKSIKNLKTKIDEIPVSLALAQTIQETGWGTSRFAKRAQALFGEWTMGKHDGVLPKDRDDDKNHMIRKFDTLEDSIRAYATNLNSKSSYRKFRLSRQKMRGDCKTPSSLELAKYINLYSEQKGLYIKQVRSIIADNRLTNFDEVKLEGSKWQFNADEKYCEELRAKKLALKNQKLEKTLNQADEVAQTTKDDKNLSAPENSENIDDGDVESILEYK
jgi:Bax protein